MTLTWLFTAPRRSCAMLAFAATLVLILTGSAAPASAANALPDASFGVFPSNPVSGQTVRLVSYACDPDGYLFDQVWDLDGDGFFDDGFGREVTTTFDAGSHTVGLQASDLTGAETTSTQVVEVSPGQGESLIPPPFNPPLLSPSLVIRLAGRLTARGAFIRLLTVDAPVCSRATLRCRGRGCPVRRATRVVGRKTIHFRTIEGTRLRAGARVEVLVSKRDRIGKYTRFRIRRDRAPARFDTCLRFGDQTGSACPAG